MTQSKKKNTSARPAKAKVSQTDTPTKEVKTSKEAPKVRKPESKKYLVVIPWRKAPAQGCELELAVAGWKRHFKENHIIVVTGEDDPQMPGIEFVYSKRVEVREGQYRQHLDYVSCFRKVKAAFPESSGFIFTADDVYAVHDFDFTDVKVLKYYEGIITARADDDNAWRRDKAKGKAVLMAGNYPTRNYTTHLPQWYEWDKLEALWDKYDMDHESYLMEDLYYNIYYGDRLAVNTQDMDYNVGNIYVRGVYRPNPRYHKIVEGIESRIWIHNSPEGWVPDLERLLKSHYVIA